MQRGSCPIAEPASGPAVEEAKHVPQTNGLLSATLPQDLSPWGMFLNAVLPVKIVMVGIAIASLATWTVMLAKIIKLWERSDKRDAVSKYLPMQPACMGQKRNLDKRNPVWAAWSPPLSEKPTVPKGLLQKASRTARPHCFHASKHREHELYRETWVFSRPSGP